MIFSHISDTHLGFIQYHSEEREDDFYSAFNQAIEISIKDHVDFVIFAGDIFNVPNPSGKAILVLAKALKRLKQNNVDSFFILGEHDISRIRSYPVPFVYHKLEFSKYIGDGEPFTYRDVLIAGFDKRRKNEIHNFENDFRRVDLEAKNHRGHKILVLHQGITEINKFAGELSSNDLPSHFTYYAMGHLHDKELKKYSNLGGPLAYPGSTELTSTEGIKETEKGFYEIDISSPEATPNWLKVETRPQFSVKTSFDDLIKNVGMLYEKSQSLSRKPVVEIKIQDKNRVDVDAAQSCIARLSPVTLRYFLRTNTEDEPLGSTYLDNAGRIDDEMLRLAKSILKSDSFADFVIADLLPRLYKNQLDEAHYLIIENFNQYRKSVK